MIANRTRLGLAIVAAALALTSLGAAPAAAQSWQASRDFEIDADQVPGHPSGATRAVYRLLDPLGDPAGPDTDKPISDLYDWFKVPATPGIYKLEAWTVNAEGAELSRASTSLRFDDVAPPPPVAAGPGRWLRGDEVALLRIEAPEPLPLSGLGGYAFSLDRGGGGHPCASPSLCTAAETDLAAGAEAVALGTLPEGNTFARVASVSGAGVPSPLRTATFRVDATDPLLSLTGIPDGWSDGPVKVSAHAVDLLSGMSAAGPTGPLTAIAVDGGAPVTALGDTAATWVGGSGIHRVDTLARDGAGNVAGGIDATGPPAAVIRIDEDQPAVTFAAAQDPAEPERIEALVADPLSGPSTSRGSISLRLAGTRARYEELPTRVAAGRLVARWDSDSYPPGKYEFLAAGYDTAGNLALGTDRAHGGRMVLVNPVKTPVSLTAKLSHGRIDGRLHRVGGGGVAQQRVVVVETFAAGAEPQRRTTFRTTDASGAFAMRLGPGPTRDVVAFFAGTATLTRSSGDTAHLGVPTALRLRASTAAAKVGGKQVVFSGAVRSRGARRSVRGLPVELQFRYPGAGWHGFRTIGADRRGRFRYAYRFSDDDSRGVHFQFRAHVKGREGWPYEPGTSRPVTVTGR
jgi:hypothetical protein